MCGCGAGNPIADLCFAVCFRKVIIRLRRRVTDLGLMPLCSTENVADVFGLNGPIGATTLPTPDFSYADDFAFVIMCCATQLLNNVRIVGELAWEAFTAVGFTVNFGPTKSAVVARWNGPQANVFKRLLAM